MSNGSGTRREVVLYRGDVVLGEEPHAAVGSEVADLEADPPTLEYATGDQSRV
jgi:hypothetical protein